MEKFHLRHQKSTPSFPSLSCSLCKHLVRTWQPWRKGHQYFPSHPATSAMQCCGWDHFSFGYTAKTSTRQTGPDAEGPDLYKLRRERLSGRAERLNSTAYHGQKQYPQTQNSHQFSRFWANGTLLEWAFISTIYSTWSKHINPSKMR